MNTRLRATLVAAAGAVVLSLPAPAHAVDHRPCVSKPEFWARYHYPVQDQKAVEQRWEVQHAGRRARGLEDRTTYVLAYKACGFTRDEVKVYVQYDNEDHTVVAALWWRTDR